MTAKRMDEDIDIYGYVSYSQITKILDDGKITNRILKHMRWLQTQKVKPTNEERTNYNSYIDKQIKLFKNDYIEAFNKCIALESRNLNVGKICDHKNCINDGVRIILKHKKKTFRIACLEHDVTMMLDFDLED